ncbi:MULTISPECIES: type III secretion system export apparatus subunit SctR [Pseudoalteromonas]|uniref:Type III secretion system protein SsaR n=1 Tax=Pseudoalteromonas piratica TaxID=1348114 RepID=A0A0A7EK45_9GAMM|nr:MULTISPECIES: type III secretion system export apparatus subunit SctR [Pseudoalteromonas]AIY66923.1 type III secretion system protein SsaR [Pseudoalteromonas piratica]ATD01025.1 type III secretion protein R [Pseudoalteromonas spongiae UST010723-006]MCF6455640.1 type III secretion system export apparatus subunit SctR [Pseudoalteromonas sp. MMG024]MEC8325386.1 type III secretion system export apparatus subunit SctR [Pseudomonadota bacterium]
MLGNDLDYVSLIIALGALALVPFLAVMATSFIKIVIVFSLLRNALGVQQTPPNMALYGVAMVLTLYVMAPVGFEVKEYMDNNPEVVESPERFGELIDNGLKPYLQFLHKNTTETERDFFINKAHELWPEKHAKTLNENSLLVLMPAFTVTQITEAFKIGFLIYLPFLVIDLIVSNILLAMGMMMVSPMTISLPFKLLVFVLLDGWTRLTHGLIAGY